MSIFNNFFWDFYWRRGNVRALWECNFFMNRTYNEKVMLPEAVLASRRAVRALCKTLPLILKFYIQVANITFFEIFQKKKLSIVQKFHSKRTRSFRAPFKKNFPPSTFMNTKFWDLALFFCSFSSIKDKIMTFMFTYM